MINQETRVLKLLRKAGSRGVPNYKFQQHRILCYTKIISNLRSDGYNILTERQFLPNGRATGTYNYVLIEENNKPWWRRSK